MSMGGRGRSWYNNLVLVLTLLVVLLLWNDANASVNYLHTRGLAADDPFGSDYRSSCRSRRRSSSNDIPHRLMNHNRSHNSVVHLSTNAVDVSSSISQEVGSSTSSGGNPVQQMSKFVVDSFQRFITGTKMLYSNHQTCNAIRAKQKLGGSISFQEFEFLRKGKEDRSKLGNIVFLMVFSSSVLPYALMFFPDMIPSPFQPFDKVLTKYETLSRVRAHAVVETLLAMENAAISAPISSKFNPFSGGAVRREMERITGLNNSAGVFFSAVTFDDILEKIDSALYFASSDTIKERNQKKKLVMVPKPIVKGIGKSLGFSSYFPNFMLRSKIVDHMKVLCESDEFLINENVDMSTLSRETLLDACGIRFIGTPRSSDDELRKGLSHWLKFTSRFHSNSDSVYNRNLSLISLLCFNAVHAVKDPKCESTLPRLMFTSGVTVPTQYAKTSSPDGSLGMSM